MDIKKALSPFQLEGTRIVEINVTNKLINISDTMDIENHIQLKNFEPEIHETDDKLYATFLLEIQVISTDKKTSEDMKISITIEGLFTTTDKDKEKFQQMLILNGNTTLYSILRSHIITISSLSVDSGSIVLPMINFVELLKLKQLSENDKTNN